MPPHVVRASEIGSYLYCRRAWWYRRQGVESENEAEMVAGTELHARHGRRVMVAGLLRIAAYAMLLAASVLLVLALTGAMFR
jgi:CRISPR/Cas system-associated exonuclease Cas4 (RecB family)